MVQTTDRHIPGIPVYVFRGFLISIACTGGQPGAAPEARQLGPGADKIYHPLHVSAILGVVVSFLLYISQRFLSSKPGTDFLQSKHARRAANPIYLAHGVAECLTN